jgi:hypothetical protein
VPSKVDTLQRDLYTFFAVTALSTLVLLELLNEVWDLGLVLLTGCSGGAHELRGQAWLRRVYRAFDLMWFASVVLHDSWWWCHLKAEIHRFSNISFSGANVKSCVTSNQNWSYQKNKDEFLYMLCRLRSHCMVVDLLFC